MGMGYGVLQSYGFSLRTELVDTKIHGVLLSKTLELRGRMWSWIECRSIGVSERDRTWRSNDGASEHDGTMMDVGAWLNNDGRGLNLCVVPSLWRTLCPLISGWGEKKRVVEQRWCSVDQNAEWWDQKCGATGSKCRATGSKCGAKGIKVRS